MDLFLDTEFNGFDGPLISMALVNGQAEFYEVVELPGKYMTAVGYNISTLHPWVQENVIPVLNKDPIPYFLFKAKLWVFLKRFDNPTIVCDWFEDAVHFLNQLKGKDYGSSITYPHSIKVITQPDDGIISKIPHNALEDAKALMHWYRNNDKDLK